ncbi:sugar MFS transporter [Bdellovibrio bacteriovorus]|uniref:MFS transporter n=1 Tax=Bdellovibrio bacteriovorus TaxID=959 RepID=UPI0035A5ADB0
MIWPFIFLSYASLFVFGLTDNIRGPLFPEILKQFGVSDGMGSLMFAFSNISGLISSYACRYLLRRYDRLTVLKGGTVGLIVSLLGLALSPVFPMFLFFSFGFGFSMGILGLVPNVLVPMGSSPERKQQMLAGLHTMYGLASLMAPLMAASIEYLTGSWRWTFAAATVGPISLFLYMLHPSHKSLHTRSTVSDDQHRANKKKNLKPQLFLAIMLSLAVAAEIMVSTRLALYMQRIWNFSMESSSIYVTYFFVSMVLGRFAFAVIHFRQSPRFLLSVSLVVSLAVLLAGVYIHPLFLAGTGLAIAPFYPLAISWISSEFPEDLDTAVTYMMTTDSLMLIVMHVAIGKLTDFFGIQNAILAGSVFLVGSFVMVNGYTWLFKRSQCA